MKADVRSQVSVIAKLTQEYINHYIESFFAVPRGALCKGVLLGLLRINPEERLTAKEAAPLFNELADALHAKKF